MKFDEITYPLLNFNGATVEIWECISNFTNNLYECYYLSMPILNLNHVSKRSHSNCVQRGRMKHLRPGNGDCQIYDQYRMGTIDSWYWLSNLWDILLFI